MGEQVADQTYRKALAVIEKLRAELADARSEVFSPVAVVGMGCRYPGGADDPQQYWDTLVGKVDGVGEVPADRWDADAYFDPQGGPGRTISRWGGFLEDIDQFDPSFFQLSVREAVEMDPNQRLAMEVTWQALEDAGRHPDGDLRRRDWERLRDDLLHRSQVPFGLCRHRHRAQHPVRSTRLPA